MAYNMYPNNQFYLQDLQNMKDRIDVQMRQIQQNQAQQVQPQPITQNFQLAPTQSNNEIESKYVNSIEEVKNTFVIKTGVFVNKDYSKLWIKDVTGNIRVFNTEEVIEMDEKDREINELKKQINEMKGMIENARERSSEYVDEPIAVKKSTKTSSSTKSNAK